MQNEEENKLRKELENELGIEFLSEDEIDSEVGDAVAEAPHAPEPASPGLTVTERAVPVSEIISRCNEQGQKMSRTNPNRFLLYMCATALRQLTQQIDVRDSELTALRKKYEPQ